jgi:hypothetical protein
VSEWLSKGGSKAEFDPVWQVVRSLSCASFEKRSIVGVVSDDISSNVLALPTIRFSYLDVIMIACVTYSGVSLSLANSLIRVGL